MQPNLVSILLSIFIGTSCVLLCLKAPRVVNKLFFRFIKNLVEENIGHEPNFHVIIGSIFLSTLIMNLLSIFGFFPVFSIFYIPISYTVISFIISVIIGIYRKKLGFFLDFIPEKVPLVLKPLFFFIEFLGFIIKPFTTTVRIFFNLTVSHLVIHILYDVVNHFGYIKYITPIIFIAINGIEIVSAILQAFLFTNFISLFIGQAIKKHH